MAEQPVNTNIVVNRHVRTKRSDTRFTSVKKLAMNMASLETVVPGEEVEILRTWDATKFVTQTWYGGKNGMPLVVYPREVTTYAEVLDAGIDVEDYKVGRDRFFVKESGHEDEDLFADIQGVK